MTIELYTMPAHVLVIWTFGLLLLCLTQPSDDQRLLTDTDDRDVLPAVGGRCITRT